MSTTTTYTSTNARPCASCQQRQCLASCPDNLDYTSIDGMTMTDVIHAISKGPQSHAEGRNRPGRVPVWTIACVFVGSVLAGLGLVFQDPVARMIWEAIHR